MFNWPHSFRIQTFSFNELNSNQKWDISLAKKQNIASDENVYMNKYEKKYIFESMYLLYRFDVS